MKMKQTFEENAASYYRYSQHKSNAHYAVTEMYRRRHMRLGIAVVILTSMVGTSVFASLQGSIDPSVQTATALLSVAAVVVAAAQTFLGFADLQSQHKTAAVGYARVKRETELLRMKFPNAAGRVNEPGTAEIESVKKHLDELDSASPPIPNRIWDKIWGAAAKNTPEG